MQPQTTSDRAAFSIAEVIARTGLGRDTVYGLIRDGQLVARKVGRRTLVVSSDLEKFLTSLPAIGRAA
jgi:excisionase family DNA binding protein